MVYLRQVQYHKRPFFLHVFMLKMYYNAGVVAEESSLVSRGSFTCPVLPHLPLTQQSNRPLPHDFAKSSSFLIPLHYVGLILPSSTFSAIHKFILLTSQRKLTAPQIPSPEISESRARLWIPPRSLRARRPTAARKITTSSRSRPSCGRR
ncbi:hypothetical protein GE09DRAFT_684253 [Coniochaeta sp. 2T2.1]|nr:hypothetical protein GE09DRAFT_684253 [Coniochaeta sp. 2T2.1]